MTIDEVLTFEEMQVFDRKSINIDAKALAITLVAFANADGGTVAIGISDKTKRIEGVDFETAKLNELLRPMIREKGILKISLFLMPNCPILI